MSLIKKMKRLNTCNKKYNNSFKIFFSYEKKKWTDQNINSKLFLIILYDHNLIILLIKNTNIKIISVKC